MTFADEMKSLTKVSLEAIKAQEEEEKRKIDEEASKLIPETLEEFKTHIKNSAYRGRSEVKVSDPLFKLEIVRNALCKWAEDEGFIVFGEDDCITVFWN